MNLSILYHLVYPLQIILMAAYVQYFSEHLYSMLCTFMNVSLLEFTITLGGKKNMYHFPHLLIGQWVRHDILRRTKIYIF